jgi:AhpD family alkylhydroperoxidase
MATLDWCECPLVEVIPGKVSGAPLSLKPWIVTRRRASTQSRRSLPLALKRTWESIKQIMRPGALDPLTKEMLYLAVSATNQCGHRVAARTAAARKAGMSEVQFAELMAVVGMANETNRLANGSQVEIDGRFRV